MYGQMPPGEEMLMPGAMPLPPAAEDTEAVISAAAEREVGRRERAKRGKIRKTDRGEQEQGRRRRRAFVS